MVMMFSTGVFLVGRLTEPVDEEQRTQGGAGALHSSPDVEKPPLARAKRRLFLLEVQKANSSGLSDSVEKSAAAAPG